MSLNSRVVITKDQLDKWSASATKTKHLSEDPVSQGAERLTSNHLTDFIYPISLDRMVQHSLFLPHLWQVSRQTA